MLNPELVTAIGAFMVAALGAFAANKMFTPGRSDPMAALIKLLEGVERQSGIQTNTYGQNMEYFRELNSVVKSQLTAMNAKLNEIIVLINDVRLDNARRGRREGE